MKIYLHSYQTQVTIITPCGHAKYEDTAHYVYDLFKLQSMQLLLS